MAKENFFAVAKQIIFSEIVDRISSSYELETPIEKEERLNLLKNKICSLPVNIEMKAALLEKIEENQRLR